MGTVIVNRALDPNAFASSINLLSNGGFEQWNYGTSFSSPIINQLVIDGWAMQYNGAPTYTVSQEAGAGNFDTGLYSAKLSVTALGGSTYVQLTQAIPNYQEYRGTSLTLSVRVKANAAADLWITDGISGTGSTAHTGDNTWQTLTATDIIASNASYVQVWLRLQSTGTAYFDSAMLVVGSQALTYIPENPEIGKLKTGSFSDLQKNAVNLLTNGSFEIWQRGVTFTNPVDSTHVADRWRSRGIPTAFTITRNAVNVDNGQYSLSIDVTNTGGTTSSSIQQDIENFQAYRGKTLSLSVRVKTTITKARLQWDDGIGGGYSSYHTGSGNWETLAVTFAVASNASNLSVLVGQRNEGGGIATGTVYIDSAMLVIGSNPAPFVPMNPANEMERCQRYYEKSDGTGNQGAVCIFAYGAADASSYFIGGSVPFATSKNALPTVTPNVYRVQEEGSSTNLVGSYTVGNDLVGINSFRVYIYKAIAGNRPNMFQAHWIAEVI